MTLLRYKNFFLTISLRRVHFQHGKGLIHVSKFKCSRPINMPVNKISDLYIATKVQSRNLDICPPPHTGVYR